MSWDNTDATSPGDPIKDIRELVERVMNRRWICERCGFETIFDPYHPGIEKIDGRWQHVLYVRKCGNCNSHTWKFTDEPKERG